MSGGFVDRRTGDSADSGVSADDLDMSADARARRMGWYPKDEFHGRPDDWIPAEKFIERAEREMPILRENLRRFDVRTAQAERNALQAQARIGEMAAKMEEMSSAFDSLRTLSDTAEKRGFDRALAAYKKEAQEAAAEGDSTRAAAAVDGIKALYDARTPVAPAPVAKPPAAAGGQPQGAADPVEVAWVNSPERAWYRRDPGMTKFADLVYGELNSSPANANLSTAEKLAEVERQVGVRYSHTQYFFDKAAAPASKVAKVNDGGDIAPGGGSNKLSKTFDSLEPAVKAEYNRIAKIAEMRKGKTGYKPYTKAEFLNKYLGEEE